MPSQNYPIEPSAFRELQRRVERIETENHRTAGRKLITVDRFTTADLPAPTEGQLAIETADDTFKYYANQEWRTVATGGGGASFAFDLRLPATGDSNAWYSAVDFTYYDMGCWFLRKDVSGYIYGLIRIGATAPTTPQVVLEIGSSATSGVTRLNVASAAIADGEGMNVGSDLTDETAQDITVPATAYMRKTVTFNLTPTIAANDLLIIEIQHLGAHANDTLAVNTLLWGAWLGDGG